MYCRGCKTQHGGDPGTVVSCPNCETGMEPAGEMRGGMIQWETTERGYCRGEFTDAYGKQASIQTSSWATTDAIWLGLNEGVHHHVTGECLARMHLTREHAAELWPLLKSFAETGDLAPERGG